MARRSRITSWLRRHLMAPWCVVGPGLRAAAPVPSACPARRWAPAALVIAAKSSLCRPTCSEICRLIRQPCTYLSPLAPPPITEGMQGRSAQYCTALPISPCPLPIREIDRLTSQSGGYSEIEVRPKLKIRSSHIPLSKLSIR